MSEWAVEARGLRKTFGHIVAVDSLHLQVRPGEVFGIVGPDGAGKTTTFRILVGAVEPDAGEAFVAGFNVRTHPEEVKRRIGYMSQRFSLYGDLTVQENMDFFADVYQVPGSERLARQKELLEFSRLAPFRKRLAQNLSGGMKQKLALACTLIHTPEILFLDEPTTGVDPVSRRDFWRILYTLVGKGMTLVVSTPYMDEAERCSRIAFMYNGRIIECDTPDNLRSRISGNLWEIICHPQRRAREIFAQLPEVKSVRVYGDRLHVWLEDARTGFQPLQEILTQSGIQVEHIRQVVAGLEDVFVSIIEKQRQETR
jgi:ABC-2 type transport system ATP-binding protein